MSDEEDYMSDKFLASAADVRPSLIQNRSKKRQLEVDKRKADDDKRMKEERLTRTGTNSNEKLQEALKRPIEATNKGFQLLAKMGYTPGQALGKSSTENVRTEPIGISIKNDRGGLGREQALLELSEKRRQLRLQHLQRKSAETEVLTAEEFRKRATQKAEERFVQGALRRCQMSCESLDTKANVKVPELSWFWPEQLTEVDEDDISKDDSENDTEDEEYTNTEKLEMYTNYLRSAYWFCFWCGIVYKDQFDLDENCTGLTREEH